MKITLNWPVVMLTFIISLILIYGANYWCQQNLVMKPLREQLLSLEGVYDVQIEDEREKSFIIYLGRVAQLSETYVKIEDILRSRYADIPKIIIVDQRNSYLISLYNRIHFALMEGERQGNYTEMDKKIAALLKEETGQLTYSLMVERERIYLQLHAEDHYLYEIIPIRSSTL